MPRRDLMAEYQMWLYDYICIDDRCDRYSMLLEFLSGKEFVWTIDHDENRAADGLMLREKFASDHNCDPDFWVGRMIDGCSVLEMMIALAMRCEDIVFDPDEGIRIACWFWEMIDTLGLRGMDDQWFDRGYAENVIENLLNRTYRHDGKGGLFQIRDHQFCHQFDMRKAEIWYQMNTWVMENFEI